MVFRPSNNFVRLLTFLPFFFIVSCGIFRSGTSIYQENRAVYYTAKANDTISSIASNFRVSPDSIMAMNGMDSSDQLLPGQRIKVGYRIYNNKAKQPYVTGYLTPVSYKNSSGRSDLSWPVPYGRVVSGFGPRFNSFHDGIDISCEEGTPVYASHDGIVVYAGNKLSGYGNLVVLRHSTGFTSIYAHNSRLLTDTGSHVKKGQIIAEVGSTGHATGPHLHYEVRIKDSQGRYVAVDPLPLLSQVDSPSLRYRVNESLTPLISRLFN